MQANPKLTKLEIIQNGIKKFKTHIKEATSLLQKIDVALATVKNTEKAYSSEAQRKYVFVVSPSANKSLVKHDIENRYNVKVESVNIMRRAGKIKRVGARTGRRSEIKKAIVTLREGNKIELT